MEKFKSISGVVIMSIVLVGIIFKFLHFSGAGILIIIGASSLALYVYYLAGLINNPLTQKRQNPFDIILDKNKMLGNSTAVFIIGLLFHILFWPGARLMLLIGSISLAVLSLLYAYIIFIKKEKIKITPPLFYTIIAILALILGAISSADKLSETQQNQGQERNLKIEEDSMNH